MPRLAGPGARGRPRIPAHRDRRDRLGRHHGAAPDDAGPQRRHRARPPTAWSTWSSRRRWRSWWSAFLSPSTGPSGPRRHGRGRGGGGPARALLEPAGSRCELFDERLTTVTAHQALAAGGAAERDRRAVVDQAAAAVMLAAWLESGGSPDVTGAGPTGHGQSRAQSPGDGSRARARRGAGAPTASEREPAPARAAEPAGVGAESVDDGPSSVADRRAGLRRGSAWASSSAAICGSTARPTLRARRGRRSS